MTEIIWATGISKVFKRDYLEREKELCRLKGLSIEIFYTGDMMFEHSRVIQRPLPRKNIFAIDQRILDERKSTVFEKIRRYIKNRKYDAVIIADHLSFFTQNDLIEAHTSSCYIPVFDPSAFFCFVDGPGQISRRLAEDENWQKESLGAKEVILWQSSEIILTKNLAESRGKPWFVLPSSEESGVLSELIFNHKAELFFLIVPMTHLIGDSGRKDRSKISVFLEKLRRINPAVINPYSIEIGKIEVENPAEEKKAIHKHILNLSDRFISQAKSCIVFMPRVVPSDGVAYEQTNSYRIGKNVYVVHPFEDAGPHKVHFSTRIFKAEDDFFEFLKNRKK